MFLIFLFHDSQFDLSHFKILLICIIKKQSRYNRIGVRTKHTTRMKRLLFLLVQMSFIECNQRHSITILSLYRFLIKICLYELKCMSVEYTWYFATFHERLKRHIVYTRCAQTFHPIHLFANSVHSKRNIRI